MKQRMLLLLTATLILFSCKKKKEDTPTPVDLTPAITAISPVSGGYNTSLTITGKNFKATPGDNSVKIGGVTVPVTAATATTLTLSVPQLLSNGGGAVEVTTANGTATGPSFTYTPEVFVGGEELTAGNVSVAKIWQNGTAQVLSNGTNDNSIHSIHVTANTIVAGGLESISGKNNPKVWLNGSPTSYTSTLGGYINSIYFANNNIYACGYENGASGWSFSRYWLNGSGSNLSAGTTSNAEATGVTVSGSNVYVCGWEVISGVIKPRLWTNGTAATLSSNTNPTYTVAVTTSGSDVYVLGYEQVGSLERVKIWRNGTETLYTGTTGIRDLPTAIYIQGNDIYVCGYESNASSCLRLAKFWKNGAGTLLETTADSQARGITVCGNDVYVTASVQVAGKTVIKVYKNGVATSLTNGATNAYSYCIALR